MGNNTSSEAPRKPQKLTKPRVGNHTTANGFSTSSVHVASKNGRFSNSYQIGPPVPISPIEAHAAGFGPIKIGATIPEEVPTATIATRRHSTGRSNLSSLTSAQTKQPVRRGTIVTSDPSTDAQLEKAHPAARPGPPQLKLSTNSSQASDQSDRQRRTVNYTLSSAQGQGSMASQQNHGVNLIRSESLKASHGVSESTWKSSHPHTAPTSPISRTNSDISLYAPMRRRSVIQTPGVATRAQLEISRPSATQNFRNSLPPTPGLSRRSSAEIVATRRMTMPAGPLDLATMKMAVETPSEADYKQLGGMKFGSLRITNGAPDITPHPQDDEKSTVDSGSGYFECKKTTSDAAVDKVGKGKPIEPPQTVALVPIQSSKETAEELSFASRVLKTPHADPMRLRTGNLEDSVSIDSSSAQPPLSTSSRQVRKNGNDDLQPAEEDLDQIKIMAASVVAIEKVDMSRANSLRYQVELEHKTVKTLARSDSGFISSPSSEASRRTLSKADSGYSSNVSLRSLRSLKPDATDRTRRSFETQSTGTPERRASGKSSSSSVPSVAPRTQHYRSKSELPPPPPPPPPDNEVPEIPARRSSLSSLAHVAIKRIPTLKRSKSRDAASVKHVIASEMLQSEKVPFKSKSFTSGSSRTRNMGFLDTSMTSAEPQTQIATTTVIDMERKPRKHKKRSSTVSHRLGPRNQSSRDTLKTILSVGSTDMLQVSDVAQADDPQTQTNDKNPSPSPPRKRSLRSLSHSLAQATSNLLHSKQHDLPSPSKVPPKDSAPSQRVALDDRINVAAPDQNQRRVSQGSSEKTRNSTVAGKQMSYRTPTKVQPTGLRTPKKLSPLKTQRSAPDIVRQVEWPLSPTIPELSHLRKDRVPPPVSMRTRSSKNLRPTPPDRSWSAPPGEAPSLPRSPGMRNRSQESLTSRRSTHSSGHSPHGSLSSIMEVQVSSPQPMSSTTSDKTSWHMKPRQRAQTSTSSRPNQSASIAPSPHNLLRNSRTLPGTAIPYPDLRNRPVPVRQRSMSDVQSAPPTWAPKRPSGAQLQELRKLTQQRQQNQSHLPDRYRRHSRHASGDSGQLQPPPSRVSPQTDKHSLAYRGIAI